MFKLFKRLTSRNRPTDDGLFYLSDRLSELKFQTYMSEITTLQITGDNDGSLWVPGLMLGYRFASLFSLV